MKSVASILLFWLFMPASAWCDVLTPDDICSIRNPEEPRISPDGSAVVFVLRTCDVESNKVARDLWYVTTSGGEPRQLTTNPADDFGPVWSPDGSALVFVSTRSGEPQLWRFDGFFGEPRQVTGAPGGATNPVWGPDGAQLYYISQGPEVVRDTLTGEDVGVHRDLLYRKGTSWEDGRFAHIYRVEANGGEGVRLTDGERHASQPAVSPDGELLAFVREAEHRGGIFSIDTDVWVVPTGGGAMRQITNNPGPDDSPQWSADGRAIYTHSILEEGYESGRRRIIRWNLATSEPTELTEGVDRHVFHLLANAKTGHLEFLVDGQGTWHLGRIADDEPGELQQLTEGSAWIWDFDSARESDEVVVVATDASHPAELWLLEKDELDDDEAALLSWDAPQRARRLTAFNEPVMSQLSLSHPSTHWVDSPSGWPIQVWYFPPANSGEDPPPMVTTLHGGPQWTLGEYFYPEIQVLAGAGYAVLAVNFTGSMGYGQAFMDAVAGDWGGAPYLDVMAAVDWAVQQGLADPARLGITGGSYGGFLTMHVVSRTERFSAAVTCRGVTDQVSQYGTTDEQFFCERDIPGTPWSNPDEYRRWSPLANVPQMKTPTMIIHSEQDARVPIGQAEELFTALLHHGVKAELISFPNEGHGLSYHGTPVHRRERLRHMLRWFDTHLK